MVEQNSGPGWNPPRHEPDAPPPSPWADEDALAREIIRRTLEGWPSHATGDDA